ncbi:hypothetical protein VWX35_07330 [Phaeobacter sp. A36a-5a]|uniref:hypothetical protein n=1 Tax=Phaeobacter bryozoorum TaxID=1086632 RepID=UPI0030C90D63
MLPMINTPDYSGEEDPIAAIKRFVHENGHSLLGAVAAAGGPRARQNCLQLFCDIAEAQRLTRPVRAEFKRFQELLSLARADERELERLNDHDLAAIDQMAGKLESLLQRIGPDRAPIDMSKMLTKLA